MLRQEPGGVYAGRRFQPFLDTEADYTSNDLTITVTGLPSTGIVLKADRLAQVKLGDTLTGAELAALHLRSVSGSSGETTPSNGAVICAPQGPGRVPIPVLTDLLSGSAADMPVSIVELPSNGSVYLVDGGTPVVSGQVMTADNSPSLGPSPVSPSGRAQLCGLTFCPAACACGQISLLRYERADQALTGQVLLIVGSDAPSGSVREMTNSTDDNISMAPAAAVLLLEADLSSLNSTAASAAVDPNSGGYSADPNLFATALTKGPLTAPSSSGSGGNGVYAYGSSSLFPTSSFNPTSYGVDVVFKPQLAG